MMNKTPSMSVEDVGAHVQQLSSNASVISSAHGNIAEDHVHVHVYNTCNTHYMYMVAIVQVVKY